MAVEFAVVIAVEFIPEGCQCGPVKEIYFKILKKGTCGVVGGVFGWPNLDKPVVSGGEGMAWHNHEDGAEYEALGVTLPRLDDHRKMNDNMSVGRYAASNGEFLAVDDVTGDRVNLIDSDGAQRLRMASMLADQVPCAKMQLATPAEFIESVVLQPGNSESFHCTAHPEAPVGLVALPGECPAKKEMSICVENESPLPITITERDCLAAGTREEEVPTLESCALFQAQREKFYSLIGWKTE